MPTLPASTVRVTCADGVPSEGTGVTLRQTVYDLVRRRDAGQPARAPRGGHPRPPATGSPQPPQRSDAEGEAVVTALRRTVACGDDPLAASPSLDGGGSAVTAPAAQPGDPGCGAPAGAPFPAAGRPRSGRPRPRKGGRPAGHAGPRSQDDRLGGRAAVRTATELERRGWRAEAISLAQGVAKVEVRALGVRGMPLVATLRTTAEVEAFDRTHPGSRPPGPRVPTTAAATASTPPPPTTRTTSRGTAAPARPWPKGRTPTPATLLALRRAAGLGQRAVAERLGVSKSYLGDVERGRRHGPKARQLAHRAAALLLPLVPTAPDPPGPFAREGVAP